MAKHTQMVPEDYADDEASFRSVCSYAAQFMFYLHTHVPRITSNSFKSLCVR